LLLFIFCSGNSTPLNAVHVPLLLDFVLAAAVTASVAVEHWAARLAGKREEAANRAMAPFGDELQERVSVSVSRPKEQDPV
jgi:hypothetical protein